MSVKYGDLFNKICNRYHLFEIINVNCLRYFKSCVTKKHTILIVCENIGSTMILWTTKITY